MTVCPGGVPGDKDPYFTFYINIRTKVNTLAHNITITRKHKKQSFVMLGRRTISISEPKHIRCTTMIPTTSKDLSSRICNNESTS